MRKLGLTTAMRQAEAVEILRQEGSQKCHLLFFPPWETSPDSWQGGLVKALPS